MQSLFSWLPASLSLGFLAAKKCTIASLHSEVATNSIDTTAGILMMSNLVLSECEWPGVWCAYGNDDIVVTAIDIQSPEVNVTTSFDIQLPHR